MVHKKLLQQIISWENTQSLPLNQTHLEQLWSNKVMEILSQLSISQDSIPAQLEKLRVQTLEPFSVLNVEKIRAQICNFTTEQQSIGQFMMQHALESSLHQFCKTIAEFKDSTIHQIHEIASSFIPVSHELYSRLDLPSISADFERGIISEAYSSNHIGIRQLRAVIDMLMLKSLGIIERELKKNIFETTREQWDKYNSLIKHEADDIQATIYSDYGNIQESFLRFYLCQLTDKASHLLHELEEYKTKKLLMDYELFLEIKLIGIMDSRISLFDSEYCKPEMKKMLAKVVNYSLPLKKRIKYVKDVERIYTVMNFDSQDMAEFYIETTEIERNAILESSVKEWLRCTEPGQRFFSLLCLVIGFSNAWTAIVNKFSESLEQAEEINGLSYSPGRRELLRCVTKNLFECGYDHQMLKSVRYNEWSIVILAENLIAKELLKKKRVDWVNEFVHINLAYKLKEIKEQAKLKRKQQPRSKAPIEIQEERKISSQSSIKSKFISFSSKVSRLNQRISMKTKKKFCKELTIECCKEIHSLHITLAISGWLSQKDEFATSWDHLVNYPFQGRTYALRWESSNPKSLKSDIIAGGGAIAMLSLIAPVLLPLNAYLVAKFPFSKAIESAKLAGKALAGFIKDGVFGKAPISLMAFSLGTSVVLHCLLALAKENKTMVHDVVLLGGAAPLEIKLWKKARNAVAGRLVNCYSKNDRILSVLYSSTNFMYAIGNYEIEIKGVENYDVTSISPGHNDYRNKLDKILQHINYNT